MDDPELVGEFVQCLRILEVRDAAAVAVQQGPAAPGERAAPVEDQVARTAVLMLRAADLGVEWAELWDPLQSLGWRWEYVTFRKFGGLGKACFLPPWVDKKDISLDMECQKDKDYFEDQESVQGYVRKLANPSFRKDELARLSEKHLEPVEVLPNTTENNDESREHNNRRLSSRRLGQEGAWGSRGSFIYEVFLQDLREALARFHITDVMGFDPGAGRAPLTPHEHCGHCGRTHAKDRARKHCAACGAELAGGGVDYGAMTDALTWAYLFRELGLDDGRLLTQLVRLLPETRRYRSHTALGRDFYKLQCYYLTHFLYVCSDWGQYTLRKELFAEEFEFIVSNMKQCIKMDDPELVGEFVQCLRILEVRDGAAAAAASPPPPPREALREGVAYLVDAERRRGGRGAFLPRDKTAYERYHAAYCGAIGLLDHRTPLPRRRGAGAAPPSCFLPPPTLPPTPCRGGVEDQRAASSGQQG